MRIRHTVVFSLNHAPGSAAEDLFFEAAQVLTQIPSVQNFETLKQVSPKNSFQFGFSMEFEDQAAYQRYNEHPDHVAFVQNRWLPEVKDFMEIDYVLKEAW